MRAYHNVAHTGPDRCANVRAYNEPDFRADTEPHARARRLLCSGELQCRQLLRHHQGT